MSKASILFVATLGYFVDVFDLLLFAIVRVASLKDLGVPAEQILPVGLTLINMQMAGMLIGGILWGILGDKRGRISVLFGSILLYSVANILNAFVGVLGEHAVLAYAVLRFLAGVGLAGELGAAITLVSEVLSVEQRGYGTTIVASLGLLGGGFACFVSEYMSWQNAYLLGGSMGLCLLVLRLSLTESSMFSAMETAKVEKGDLRVFFRSPPKMKKYLRCILIGMPIWFVVGILIAFSPELAKDLGVMGKIQSGRALLFTYIGVSIGDMLSGVLSQLFKTRKKVILFFIGATAGMMGLYLFGSSGRTELQFYLLCGVLGCVTGYWAVFVTTASEQFGTNVRATVTTTAPNFVRGSVVILTVMFEGLIPQLGLIGSAAVVGSATVVVALLALWGLEETYGKDLDFLES